MLGFSIWRTGLEGRDGLEEGDDSRRGGALVTLEGRGSKYLAVEDEDDAVARTEVLLLEDVRSRGAWISPDDLRCVCSSL